MTESNNILDQMAKDGKSEGKVSSDKLSELTNLGRKLVDKQTEVANAAEKLKQLQEEEKSLSMYAIPDLFDELNMASFKLNTGQIMEVKRSFVASITPDKKDICHEWLRNNGHESIIKHDVTVKLKKGEKKEHEEVVKQLDSLGLTYVDKEHVHSMTLKAFVKEQIESGTDFPQDDFNVFPIRKTKIK